MGWGERTYKGNGNGHGMMPAKPVSGGHIVGQPFQFKQIGVPMNAVLTCSCGGPETEVTIINSQPGQCPSCKKQFGAVFNPLTMKVEVAIILPKAETPEVTIVTKEETPV